MLNPVPGGEMDRNPRRGGGRRVRTPVPRDDHSFRAVTTIVAPPDAAQDPDLLPAWNDLVANAAEPNAFAEPWFLLASFAHLPHAGVRLLIVREGGRLLGLLPVRMERRYGRLRAAHVENHRHFHSFLGTPLVRAGSEARFWAAILDRLDRAEWARGFLHLTSLTEHGPVHSGLIAATRTRGRACDTVHRVERALLASDLDPQAYYQRTVTAKKRKELRRLAARLADLGQVATRRLGPDDNLAEWIDVFLALEASGWKGRAGSALASRPDTAAFFRAALTGAHAGGRLEILRLDLDGQPLAMLVNFLTPPGAFSFKTAYDEAYARYSPGVLIQRDNLALLARDDIAWMDSCATENHPMIDSLWAERRTLVRVTVPLAGWRRGLTFRLCRLAERSAARIRRHDVGG